MWRARLLQHAYATVTRAAASYRGTASMAAAPSRSILATDEPCIVKMNRILEGSSDILSLAQVGTKGNGQYQRDAIALCAAIFRVLYGTRRATAQKEVDMLLGQRQERSRDR